MAANIDAQAVAQACADAMRQGDHVSRMLGMELLAVGPGAVYQWMPDGSRHTRVGRSFWKQFDAPVTARNWNTAQKLRALLGG